MVRTCGWQRPCQPVGEPVAGSYTADDVCGPQRRGQEIVSIGLEVEREGRIVSEPLLGQPFEGVQLLSVSLLPGDVEGQPQGERRLAVLPAADRPWQPGEPDGQVASGHLDQRAQRFERIGIEDMCVFDLAPEEQQPREPIGPLEALEALEVRALDVEPMRLQALSEHLSHTWCPIGLWVT